MGGNGCKKKKRAISSRTKRLFEIYDLISMNPKHWTCGSLAARFNVSRTQIYRDINQLREIGREIHSSPKGYYIFKKQKLLPPMGGNN